MAQVSKDSSRVVDYDAPPIVECVIELNFEQPLSDAEFARAVRAMASGYEHQREDGEVDVRVTLVAPDQLQPELVEKRPIHHFSNDEQTDFARIEKGKIHWTRMPPYTGWEVFFARFMRDFSRLPKGIRVRKLRQIGLRYINRIDVPLDDSSVGRYEDFLTVNLSVPAFLDPHGRYFWEVEKRFDETSYRTLVRSGIGKQEIPGTVAVVLDIDVLRDVDMPVGLEGISETLADLRGLKNLIFEASITDTARKTFR